MRKKLSLFLAIVACVANISTPVMAGNSQLDVKVGDAGSFEEKKDDDETNYYISTALYMGVVEARSVCVDSKLSKRVGSSFQTVYMGKRPYAYDCKVYPGYMYQLIARGVASPGWHLTGTYCP